MVVENENSSEGIKADKTSEHNVSQTSSSTIQNFIKQYEKYNSLSILIAVISVLTILFIAADECRICFNKLEDIQLVTSSEDLKTYWVYGKNIESGYLKHVFAILDRLGYKNDPNETNWDLLWAHDYPFRKLYPQLSDLKPQQKVNHFPGSGYLTNKVDLAISGIKYIPPAFKLPQDKEKLLDYATDYANRRFVQKNNDHRNIKIRNLTEIDLDTEGTFIQEFVEDPLLIDGYKFDIGIYTIITSVDPLRIYIYNGDALLRFCPEVYHPFDPENLDKYVVGDDYLPIWNVPSLGYYYNHLGFGMRESLNAFLETEGRNSRKIWDQVEDSIRTVVLEQEHKILEVVNKFKHKRNFFEMMRFDFVVDDKLNVYLLEANMSPNLSSAHYPPNQLLYEQILYNLMGLVGLGERVRKNTLAVRSEAEKQMVVSDKNLATFPKICNDEPCRSTCFKQICRLCRPCMTPDTIDFLQEAYREHLDRGDCKRIFPPPMEKNEDVNRCPENLTPNNKLQYEWFQGKCNLDSTWCR